MFKDLFSIPPPPLDHLSKSQRKRANLDFPAAIIGIYLVFIYSGSVDIPHTMDSWELCEPLYHFADFIDNDPFRQQVAGRLRYLMWRADNFIVRLKALRLAARYQDKDDGYFLREVLRHFGDKLDSANTLSIKKTETGNVEREILDLLQQLPPQYLAELTYRSLLEPIQSDKRYNRVGAWLDDYKSRHSFVERVTKGPRQDSEGKFLKQLQSPRSSWTGHTAKKRKTDAK